jgi:hypothetical protein
MRSNRALLLPLLLALPLAAQSQTPAPAPKAPEPPRDEYVTEKGFKSKLFEVKHKDPSQIASARKALGSGFKGSGVIPNRDLGTVAVRDFPENLAVMEEAIKRLDQPPARRADVELKLHVLVAGRSDQTSTPEDLKDVMATLKSTLAFKGYQPLATFVQRVQQGARGVEGAGLAASPDGPEKVPVQLEYRINAVDVDSATAPATVRLDGFHLSANSMGHASVRTDVTLRDGEKVVVGTSTLKDRALIGVLAANLVK